MAGYILDGIIAIIAVDVAKDYSLPCDFGGAIWTQGMPGMM